MGYLFFLLLRVFFEATFVVLLGASTISTFLAYRLSLKPVRIDRVFMKAFLSDLLKKNNIQIDKLNIFLFWDLEKEQLVLLLKKIVHPQLHLDVLNCSIDLKSLMYGHLLIKEVHVKGAQLNLDPQIECPPQEDEISIHQICSHILKIPTIVIQDLNIKWINQSRTLNYKGIQLRFLHTLNQGYLIASSPQTQQLKAKITYALHPQFFQYSGSLEKLVLPLKTVLPSATTLALKGSVEGTHFFSSAQQKGKNKLAVLLKQIDPVTLKEGKNHSVLKEMFVEGFIDNDRYWIQNYSFFFNQAFFHFSGHMTEVENCLWKGAFQIRSDCSEIPLSVLGALWPPYAGENVREWVFSHFKGGSLSHIFTLMQFHCQPEMIVDDLFSAFVLNHSDLWINENIPTIYRISAKATADLKEFKIQIKEGTVWDQKITSGTVNISPLKENSFLTFETNLEGELEPVLSGLKILNLEDLEMLKLEKIGGQSQMCLSMRFPLLDELSFDQIDHHVQAQVKNGSFYSQLIQAKISQANLQIECDKKIFKIQGKSLLDQQPAEWNFEKNENHPTQARLTFKGKLTCAFLENHSHIRLHPYIGSIFKCDLEFYPLRQFFQTQLSFAANQLNVPWLGLQKMPAVCLHLSGKLNEKNEKSVFQCRLSGGIKGSAVLHADFDPFEVRFATAHFQAWRENIWQKYQIKYQLTPEKLSAFFHGPYLDLSVETQDIAIFSEKLTKTLKTQNAFFAENKWLLVHPYPSDKMSYDIESVNDRVVGKKLSFEDNPSKNLRSFDWDLNISEFCSKEKSFYLNSKMTGNFVGKDLSFSVDHLKLKKGFLEIYPDRKLASVQKPLLTLKVTPTTSSQTLVEADADNISLLLRFFDIAEQTSHGHLKLTAHQSTSGIYQGSLVITDIQAKVPLLGKLLALASPMMFLELASSKLSFSKVSCDFRYAQGLLSFKEGVVKGLNLGLTLLGNLNLKTEKLHLVGAIIPFYFLNTFFRNVPLLSWLFGGNQGFFSVEFRVSGDIDNPKIDFQPISILKMGFMRSLFNMEL
jgi:hypothetical protein